MRAALACGLLIGIGIGDGTSGLLRVASTTGSLSRTLIAVVGLAPVVVGGSPSCDGACVQRRIRG